MTKQLLTCVHEVCPGDNGLWCPCRDRESSRSPGGYGAWQPIETAPRDGRRVILAWGGASVPGFFLDNGSRYQFWRTLSGEFSPPGKPTHWMPFPEAP